MVQKSHDLKSSVLLKSHIKFWGVLKTEKNFAFREMK